MDKETAIRLFEDKRVRVLWNEEKQKWHFSIIDVIEVLTGTDRRGNTGLIKGLKQLKSERISLTNGKTVAYRRAVNMQF